MTDVPTLRIARSVTREHGQRFADAWLEQSLQTSAMSDAFMATGVVAWPEADDFGDPAQSRFHDISDEIERQVSGAVLPALADAFVKAAKTVLADERRRQRRAQTNDD